MKVSSIYGKKVISSAGKEGYVVAIHADGNEIKCLICADENEKRFAVSVNGIKNLKDKIVFKDEVKVGKCGVPLRLGKPVFDCGGAYVGRITDFTAEKGKLTFAHVGNKKFPVGEVALGDAVIVKNSARVLKSDVKKNGKVLIRRGTPLSPEVLAKAQNSGEYIQTNLKTLL